MVVVVARVAGHTSGTRGKSEHSAGLGARSCIWCVCFLTSTRNSCTVDEYARYVYSDGRQVCSCCAYLVWSGRGDLVLVSWMR